MNTEVEIGLLWKGDFFFFNGGDSDKKRAPRAEPSSRGQADERTCAGVLMTARASSSTKAVLHVSAMLILYVHSSFLSATVMLPLGSNLLITVCFVPLGQTPASKIGIFHLRCGKTATTQ